MTTRPDGRIGTGVDGRIGTGVDGRVGTRPGQPALPNTPRNPDPRIGADGRIGVDGRVGTDARIGPDGRRIDGRVDGRVGVDGRVDGRVGPDGRRIDGRNDGRVGVDGRFDGRNDSRFDGRNDGRDGNRVYSGNTINFGNRSVQFANQNYRPAYARHSQYYRGYWNGSRLYGPNYATGYRGYGPLNGGWGYGGGIGNGGLGLTLAQLGLNYALGARGYGYGGYGGYGYSPVGWGLGGWGLGSMAYNSGYLPYSNPYYVGGGAGIYNYAQPIPVAYTTVAAVEQPAAGVATADEVMNVAVAAFKANDYNKTIDILDGGIRQYPDDSVLHEFRSLALFARQDFQQSAATIHSVLAVGPGWNWTTMSGLYADPAQYTPHLRALEAYAGKNPQDSASRFLLAYHYMVAGHNDAASRQLAQVVKLTPNDRVADDLLKMVTPPATAQAQADPAQPPVPANLEQAPKIDPATLVGSWTATREGGEKFSLNLQQDQTFKWNYAQPQQQPTEFTGKYTVEGNVIALEREEGGSLIGQVTPEGNGKFNFRLVGAPPEDRGLVFVR